MARACAILPLQATDVLFLPYTGPFLSSAPKRSTEILSFCKNPNYSVFFSALSIIDIFKHIAQLIYAKKSESPFFRTFGYMYISLVLQYRASMTFPINWSSQKLFYVQIAGDHLFHDPLDNEPQAARYSAVTGKIPASRLSCRHFSLSYCLLIVKRLSRHKSSYTEICEEPKNTNKIFTKRYDRTRTATFRVILNSVRKSFTCLFIGDAACADLRKLCTKDLVIRILRRKT